MDTIQYEAMDWVKFSICTGGKEISSAHNGTGISCLHNLKLDPVQFMLGVYAGKA